MHTWKQTCTHAGKHLAGRIPILLSPTFLEILLCSLHFPAGLASELCGHICEIPTGMLSRKPLFMKINNNTALAVSIKEQGDPL